MSAPHSEVSAPAGINPGETLRIERENKGWSLSAVAQQLNLSERSLSQIEAGDFSQLPGHTFARGYVRAYAKLLGLDQALLVQQYGQHTGSDSTGSSVHSLGQIDEPVRLSRSVMRFFSFALLLIVAGSAFYWWQEQESRSEPAPSVSALERIEVEAADGTTEIHLLDRPAEPADAAAAAAAGVDAEVSQDAAPAAAGEQPAVAVDPLAPAAGGAEAVLTAEPASAAAPVLAAGEGRLELEFVADCWTRVNDADGRVLYSGLAKAGTTRTVTGKAPLELQLGYAPGAIARYNGNAVNLASHTRGEVARLKLGR